jgi:hypothetical protein
MALATGAPFALARCGLQQPTLLGGQRISAAGPQRSSRQTEGARAHAGRCTGAHRRRCERRTGTWRVQQGAARAAREQPRSALRSRPRVSAAPAPLLLASAARAAHGGCTLCGRVSAGPAPLLLAAAARAGNALRASMPLRISRRGGAGGWIYQPLRNTTALDMELCACSRVRVGRMGLDGMITI